MAAGDPTPGQPGCVALEGDSQWRQNREVLFGAAAEGNDLAVVALARPHEGETPARPHRHAAAHRDMPPGNGQRERCAEPSGVDRAVDLEEHTHATDRAVVRMTRTTDIEDVGRGDGDLNPRRKSASRHAEPNPETVYADRPDDATGRANGLAGHDADVSPGGG